MAQRAGKRIAVFLAAAMLAGSLTGCGLLKNTEIVFTTGLSGDQLFKIGKSVCTLPEAMIYVMDYQRQYEGVYGVEMWEHDFGGVTFEEYVKDTIVDQLASMKAITLLAGDYGVELDSSEEERVSEAADAYYGALTEDQIRYMDLELEDVEALYRDHALSGKVYEEITKDVNTEVSDDEARIITVQQIYLDSPETAQSVKEQLDKAGCTIVGVVLNKVPMSGKGYYGKYETFFVCFLSAVWLFCSGGTFGADFSAHHKYG